MRPKVITLYSFKGGVGRTLLAANLGAIFARGGRTLLWDLDLEAPGLHRIPDLRPDQEPEEGFVEWLAQWQRAGAPSVTDGTLFERLRTSVRPTRIAQQLYTLQAFGAGADMVARFDDVDWPAIFGLESGKGIELFRQLIERFGCDGFQTILLDSRTGMTDIAGLLTAALPHVTVLVGGYSAQNTHGLAFVWRALERYAAHKTAERGALPLLRRLLVASPIPQDDLDLSAAARKLWREEFGIPPSEHLIEIPFDQRLLFTEQILAATNPDAPIVARYHAVARRLALLLEEAEGELVSERRSALMRPDVLKQGELTKDPEVLDARTRFERRVMQLLRLLGFTVQSHALTASRSPIDLVASKRLDFRDVCYLVQCKAEDDARLDLRELAALTRYVQEERESHIPGAQGMIVAPRSLPALRAYGGLKGIRVLSLADLERELFDVGPYLTHLRAEFEGSLLAGTYVGQRLALNGADDKTVPLLEHAVAWARGEGSRLWLVLGEDGIGKTAFVRRFAYELAVRCETEPDLPAPIAINLRDYATETTLEGVIAGHFRNTIGWHGNPDILLDLLGSGRALLVLDGFDEMGGATTGFTSLDEPFRRLVLPTAAPGSDRRANRVLLTSREHLFRKPQRVVRVEQIEDALTRRGAPLHDVARAFGAAIDTVLPFAPHQVDEYLYKRLGPAGTRRIQNIVRHIDLKSLASRPVLLDMIVTEAGTVAGASHLHTPGVYLYSAYTNRWLAQVRQAPGHLTPEQKRATVEELARELWNRGDQRIHYLDLFTHLRGAMLPPPGSAEDLDIEMRTAAFLVRSPDGYYRFTHRSFLEFFIARRLLRAIQSEDVSFGKLLDTPLLTIEVVQLLGDLAADAGVELRTLQTAAASVSRHPPTPRSAANALLLAYRVTRRRLGPGTAASSPARVRAKMSRFFPDHANLSGAELRNVDLSGAYLRGADLSRAKLSGTNLSGADLRSAVLDGIDSERLDLTGADLEGASATTASLVRASRTPKKETISRATRKKKGPTRQRS